MYVRGAVSAQPPKVKTIAVGSMLCSKVSQSTQDAIRTGLVQSRARGRLYEEAHAVIAEGILTNPAPLKISQETEHVLKAGLLKEKKRDRVRSQLRDSIRKGLRIALS